MEEGKFQLNLSKSDFLLYLLAFALIAGVTAFLFMRVRFNQLLRKAESMVGQAPKQVDVVLYEQNNSGESGKATLWEVDGQVIVSLVVDGTPAMAQPAHIHEGTCADLGDVTYPLTDVNEGSSDTTLDMSLDTLLAQKPQAINVHMSNAQSDVYVACGDLP